ncbi:MAG: PEP-CTERM sorting domain-containing protein [Burkholderiales bacterium]|nr:PEP-CTERM sorting domain-containing protein [Burkholderiales bacterium]MDR4516387.1 PEP-CTERM sorting domain-containing protein [Nitrosomonas sp.]
MKRLLWVFLFCFVISSANQAIATISINLDPHPSKIHTPENIFVDINVSGLQSNGINALLGAWEMDFVFDPGIFQLLPVSPAGLGSSLGNLALGEAISLVQPVTTPGVFHVGVLSLLEADAITCVFCVDPLLEDLQGDSFTLATIGLFAPSTGGVASIHSIFRTDNIILGDAFGGALTPVAHPSMSIDVVPIPATIALIGIGLLGWLAVRRSRELSFSSMLESS